MADGLESVGERASIPCLACALSKELAGDVFGIFRAIRMRILPPVLERTYSCLTCLEGFLPYRTTEFPLLYYSFCPPRFRSLVPGPPFLHSLQSRRGLCLVLASLTVAFEPRTDCLNGLCSCSDTGLDHAAFLVRSRLVAGERCS
jgi:hypothetical protein